MEALWYHKTQGEFEGVRPFIHLGTASQANMRAAGVGANIVTFMTDLNERLFVRLRDTGHWNERQLKALQRQGYRGAVYLNRFEGIPLAEIQAARDKAANLDALSDGCFRKLVPSAQDSVIIFDPADVTLMLPAVHAAKIARLERKSAVTAVLRRLVEEWLERIRRRGNGSDSCHPRR